MADQQLPAGSIEPIAISVAKRPRTVGTVMFGLASVFLLGLVAMLVEPNQYPPYETICGGAFWLLVLPWIGLRARRKAATILAAGRRASTDPTIAWHLRGLVIIAVDSKGAPCPELTFKIRPIHQTMLSVPPVARALP